MTWSRSPPDRAAASHSTCDRHRWLGARGHREQGRQAKRRQLEINALEPFLSRLPDEQAEALRAKTADRILVQPASESANPSAVTASPDLNDLGTVVGAAAVTEPVIINGRMCAWGLPEV